MTGTGIAWTGTPAVLSAEGLAVLARLFRGRWDAAVRAGLPAVVPGMTFNPWVGCQKVSPGCENCYAEALCSERPDLVYGPGAGRGLPVWGPRSPRRVTGARYWENARRWDRAAAASGVRVKVFCASLSDIFESDRALGVTGGERFRARTLSDVRAALWELVESTPHIDWLLLTKRPENVVEMVPPHWLSAPPLEVLRADKWPANVWVGTTVEDERRARERLPHLLRVPARVRFASYEPALESVDFAPWLARGLDWLIVGGESGVGARPFDLAWGERAVSAALSAGVPVFFKQTGANPVLEPGPVSWATSDPKGGDPDEWPDYLRVRQWPGARS